MTVGADGSETMTQEGGDSGAVLGTTPALVVAGKTPVELSKLPAALKSTIPANSRITVDGTIYLAITVPRRDRAQLGQVQAQPQGVRGPHRS